MKPILTFSIILMLSLIVFTGTEAQLSSSLLPDQLQFSDQSNLLKGSFLNINGLSVQNGFNASNIGSSSISSGGSLLSTKIDAFGVTVENFAALPASKSNLDLKELQFRTIGTNDQEFWTFGITDVGVFDQNDPLQSAFIWRYNRTFGIGAIDYPLLFVNPDEGNMGMGTYSQNFNAQLYVQEFGLDQIAISANNTSTGNQQRWGMYGICQGQGTGIRFGVVGQAFTTSGQRYGVFGTADADFGYAVYASGNLAYTGTITDVSDRKLKKNIEDFTALESVMQLQPKTYEMRRDEFERMHLASGRRYGFIAQELRKVFPDLVREQVHAEPYPDGDSLQVEQFDYLGVELMGMIPILTQAMQEQQHQIEEKDERITSLEQENRQLQQKYADLENRLAQLESLLSVPETASDPEFTLSDQPLLEQNHPNPSADLTTISYRIPKGTQEALLRFTTAKGQIVRQFELTERGYGQIQVHTNTLSKGTYFYSLVINGITVQTRKMALVK